MPTYEYECTRCGHTCEEFKPVSAPKRQRCPLCRGKVERLVNGGLGVHFKGSGFYVNDSRGKKGEGPSSGREPVAPAADAPAPKQATNEGQDT